jgi:hypothetical protein
VSKCHNVTRQQKVIPRPSADYFVVGRRQKEKNINIRYFPPKTCEMLPFFKPFSSNNSFFLFLSFRYFSSVAGSASQSTFSGAGQKRRISIGRRMSGSETGSGKKKRI